MSNKRLTKHHIRPSSRGGSSLEKNLAYIPRKKHEAYHTLFSNMLPYEIIDNLVREYWNGQEEWVEEYQRRNR